ncbi:TetR family transcriptional regulator C-terminal domain-containing protein [Aestuariivirga sp.]|uniref:TetR family transcriptional regulator C-terminal domain-containing protein n=1 Tax=Aestuariivirga sp. TaxID=2650926 RepID=UPI0039E2F85E
MPKAQAKAERKTRIQSQNEEIILDAALEVFSAYGYRGGTIDQIAARCGLSKPNLLYYFRRKDDIYKAVLERTLADWLEPLRSLDPAADPVAELGRYISAKLDLTFERPAASRLFANEILHGAPHVARFLKGPLKELVEAKALVIRRWVAEGKLRPVDATHFIFAIWAVTQHYADFAVQVEAITGTPDRERVRRAVLDILLAGIAPGSG